MGRIASTFARLWKQHVRRAWPLAVIVLTFAALAAMVTWPLVTQLDTGLAQHPGWSRDAYHHTYVMWWFKRALLEQHKNPADLGRWIYYPAGGYYPLLLTYSTVYVPSLPLQLFLSPVAAYNVVFLLTFFFCGLTTYALCAYLTGNRWAGLLGGIIYAFFPGRVAHGLAGHIELASIYWFPLYLLLLIKLVRKPKPVTAVLCGLVLGASCLVQPLFIPFLLAPMTVVWLLCEVFLLRRKVERRAWLALAGVLILGAAIATPFFWPVLNQQAVGGGEYLEGIGTVSFSADLLGIVAPSPVHPILDALGLVPEYARRAAPPDWRIAELLTYAGIVPLGLGILSVVAQRRKVAAWALLAVVAAVLSLGPVLKVNGEVVSFSIAELEGSAEVTIALPYALLANLPLLSLNRGPARLNTTLMLALAVLSSYGLVWLLARLKPRWQTAVALALCLFTLVEFLVIWPVPTTPVEVPDYMADMAGSSNEGAVLNLPVAAGHVKEMGLFSQTLHQRPVFDCWFQRDLPVFPDVAGFLDGLLYPQVEADIVPTPAAGDRAVVARAEGVGHVFLYTLYASDVDSEMGLLETEFGPPRSTESDIVIYEVTPGPATVNDLVYALPNNDWRSSERGWQYREEWDGRPARWLSGSADLYIYSPLKREGVLEFKALPFAAPHRLQVAANQEPLSPLVISDWMTYTTPSFVLQPGLNQITLSSLDGCTPYEGDPRCSGVTRGRAGAESGCSHYIETERCLSVLFQDVRFAESDILALQPVNAVLGDRVSLLGYHLSGEPAAGEALYLTLYWQALHPPAGDYTVFAHLLGADGQLAAQYDAPPLDGLYPTSRWIKGDRIEQRIELRVPPDVAPGTYELVVGMYTYPDIVRLTVASDRPRAQDDLVWLQTVLVE
jgi:hypothetical protein